MWQDGSTDENSDLLDDFDARVSSLPAFSTLTNGFQKWQQCRADATTANARAVVLRTYSSMLSISGRMVAIIVARPAFG